MSSNNKVSTARTIVQDNAGGTQTDLRKLSQFELLFEADKNRLYAYIHAFVADTGAADDIFQETCLALWQEFASFELGTNFSKWANVIAFYRVQRYRRIHERYQLGLSDDFMTEFSRNIDIIETNQGAQEQKWQSLEYCCARLSAPLKKVYESFYIDNLTAQQIADNTGRSIHAIRKVVHKVRKYLFDCVDKHQKRHDHDAN